MSAKEAWYITERWQEYEGELRVALVRLAGIAVFYSIELLNFYGLKLGGFELPSVVNSDFHTAATALSFGWALVSFAVIFCIRQSFFPKWLKYVTTALDFIFLTQLLLLADGLRSPLLPLYFLLLVLAGLRLNLRLVWFSTAAAFLSYLTMAAFAHFMFINKRVPAYHGLLFLASIGLMGVLVGQVTRRVKRIALEYQARFEALQRAGDEA